jgi:arginine decarboxylase
MGSKNTTADKLDDRVQRNFLLVGNRIPHDFFVTSGAGESDKDWHAGSFHMAVYDAGIQMCNIIPYSSILPEIADEVRMPKKLIHGSVMEVIMAREDSKRDVRATAGIVYGWLYDPRHNFRKVGGIVCEYHGPKTRRQAEDELDERIKELHEESYSRYKLKNLRFVITSIVPERKYGTAIAAICFLNYAIPIVGEIEKEVAKRLTALASRMPTYRGG